MASRVYSTSAIDPSKYKILRVLPQEGTSVTFTSAGGNTSTFSNNRGADWPIALVVVLDRALSPQEVWVLSQNPWQIFAPTALNIWSDYVVGGAANWGPLLGLQNNRLIQVQE